MMLTPGGGDGNNEQCRSQRLQVRHGRVIVDEKLSVYVYSLYQCEPPVVGNR